MIIGILNPKGGAGKSTVSINLARALQKHGSVIIADADVQGTARVWADQRENSLIPVMGVDHVGQYRDLREMVKSYDFCIVDGAAKVEKLLVPQIKSCDLVIIPIQPSPFDVWACQDLIELIEARQEITEGSPKASFVITRDRQNSKLGRDVLEVVQKFEMPLFKQRIYNRDIYKRSGITGSTVLDEKWDKSAVEEIENLAIEILDFVNAPNESEANAPESEGVLV